MRANPLLKQRWDLAIRPRSFGPGAYAMAAGYRAIAVPRDRFYADPCLVQSGGASYLFFEDYRYVRGAGVISCMEIKGDQAGPAVAVLERPYHLSFPFVFRWSGEMWMIPESSANSSVELYRAVRFPAEWKLERVLLKGLPASDTVLLENEGRAWLFTCLPSRRKVWDELHIFHADSLLGEWRAHPRNPVVRDIGTARSAGSLFYDGAGLIRPGQNCAEGYGRSIRFQRVDSLTDCEYAEHTVAELSGKAFDATGVHTYSRNEEFEAIDRRFDQVDVYGKLLGLAGKTRRLLRRGADVTEDSGGSAAGGA